MRVDGSPGESPETMTASRRFGALPLFFALALAGSACRNAATPTNNSNPNPRPDAGPTTTTCTTQSDCAGVGVCIAGICQSVTACQTDDDCSMAGQICHQSRFYCVECDGRSGQCGMDEYCNQEFTCQAFASQPDAGVNPCNGTCSTRNECAVDEVCRMGECCPPPDRCRSPQDCPAATPECNGQTGQCFGGSGCFQDADCESEAACTGGRCFCDIQGAPPGTCRQRPDECQSDMDCFDMGGNFVGKFCTINTPPKRCIDAPTCASDADCASEGLVCDLEMGSPSNGYCQNGTPCPMGNECQGGQVCVNGVCVAENCQNNPGLCGPNETCDPVTLTCVPAMGGSCTMDTDCQAGYYCNLATSTCEIGCRDDTECPGGVCNAQNMCEYPMGGFCGPCMQDSDCPAGARCVDNPFTGPTCYEQCSTLLMQPCSDASASCILGNCSCL